MRVAVVIAWMLLAVGCGQAQWQILDAHTTADLRGIDNVGKGVVWASGTNGTVLRSEDGGYMWQNCTVPPGAEKLDFRGVQAFDNNTAIVMSSGTGNLSRLYKTTDGCQTWKLVFTNPDKDGFWDALLLSRFVTEGELLGDPVAGKFAFWQTEDSGKTWSKFPTRGLNALPGEGVFAASNSSLFDDERFAGGFVTGGPSGARVFITTNTTSDGGFSAQKLPLQGGSASTGGFSITDRDWCCWVVVGGDYLKPNDSAGTAAFTTDGGKHWHTSVTSPHGYRSAVAYDAAAKTWIIVGPNGTDISTDDGRNWRALKPAVDDPPDADKNWNALSLPFVVGPHGRIGMLRPSALKRSR